jgi:hypothetical protein
MLVLSYPFALSEYLGYRTAALGTTELPMPSTRDIRHFRPVVTGHFCRIHQSYAAQKTRLGSTVVDTAAVEQ